MIPGGSWVEVRWPRGDAAADVQGEVKRWEGCDGSETLYQKVGKHWPGTGASFRNYFSVSLVYLWFAASFSFLTPNNQSPCLKTGRKDRSTSRKIKASCPWILMSTSLQSTKSVPSIQSIKYGVCYAFTLSLNNSFSLDTALSSG